MDTIDSLSKKYGLRAGLVVALLVGVMGTALCEPAAKFENKLLEHLFMALAVSGFIGLFIELTLHQRITKNVFEVAIGYLLHPELRNELRWIYNLPNLCENHFQTVKIEPIPGTGLVRITTNLNRTIRNITNSEREEQAAIGIDEWGNSTEHRARIIGFEYRVNNGPVCHVGQEHVEKLEYAVRLNPATSPKFKVPSGGTFTFSSEFEEIMHENDWTFFHASTPTKCTTIEVRAPEDFVAEVSFSHRDGKNELTQLGPHTWQLNALLLPQQNIRVIWRKKRNAGTQ